VNVGCVCVIPCLTPHLLAWYYSMIGTAVVIMVAVMTHMLSKLSQLVMKVLLM
jgi:hypothetical protein